MTVWSLTLPIYPCIYNNEAHVTEEHYHNAPSPLLFIVNNFMHRKINLTAVSFSTKLMTKK